MKITKGAVILQPGKRLINEVKEAIPQAAIGRLSGEAAVAVKHKLEETLVLRNLGFDVPSPITYGWKYPGLYKPRDNQYKTSAFMTLYRRAFILNEMRCVDANTEYLSPQGWRKISEYDGGMVAQYNKDTEKATFVKPIEYIKKLCPEPMIRFKTVKGIDQLLTEGHRVLYVSSTGTKQITSAGEIEAANARALRGWSGRFITTFDMQPSTHLNMTNDELSLMVAIIADGHFNSKTTKRCTIRLLKQRKIDRLILLLTLANIEYHLRVELSGFHIFTFDAPERTKDFSKFWGASKEQLQIIVNEVFEWDGSLRKAGASDFSTTVKESADFIQYACAACGRTASLSINDRSDEGKPIEYIVHARKDAALLYLKAATSDGENINNISREPSPDGYCYCFSVPDTFLVMRRNGKIFVTGNTGKTGASLWAAEYLLQEGFIRRVLIICPKQCMSLVWEKALFECLPHRSSAVLYGDRAKRIKNLEKGTDFCIINHDGLAALSTKVKQGKKISLTCDVLKDQFDLIICDEADILGNHRTENHKALASLITPTIWLWLMTGTPTSGKYADTWGLLKLVCNKLPAPSWTRWRERVMTKLDQFKWVNKAGAQKIVFDALQPAIRFTKAECFDLPKVQFISRAAELTKEQKRMYWQMQRDSIIERTEEEGKISAPNAAARTIKMLQISSGAVRDEDGNAVILDSADRFKVLCDTMAELEVMPGKSPKKTIIAMPFTYSMEALTQKLINAGYRAVMVNGDITSQTKRNAIFKGWEEDEYDVLVVHPQVTAYGLDLTASESIIYYAPIYGIKHFSQLNERIQGEKQKGNPVIVFISATRLERERYEALVQGVQNSELLLDMYQRAIEEEIL